MILIKEGVKFDVIAPGGFLILQALKKISRDLSADLTITSGTDGEHSGPDDPHKRGEAYDVRTHNLPDGVKHQIVFMLNNNLGDRFYAFLEDAGQANEHIHVQVAKHHEFTVTDLLSI